MLTEATMAGVTLLSVVSEDSWPNLHAELMQLYNYTLIHFTGDDRYLIICPETQS